jgi:hypothetical protein
MDVTIAGRFNGPPGTANGGYACGVVAEAIGASASVRLLQPPPLGLPLTRGCDEDGVVRLRAGQTTIAEGRAGRPTVEAPAPPSLAAAARAAARTPAHHPFPTCFVCGPLRPDDGLGILPGPVGDDGLLACPWHPGADLAPDGTVDARFVWAALDCPSGFACIPPNTRTVLASMTATLEAAVEPGRAYIVTAWPIDGAGRKHRAGSAIHDADGRRVALAEALWITLRE